MVSGMYMDIRNLVNHFGLKRLAMILLVDFWLVKMYHMIEKSDFCRRNII